MSKSEVYSWRLSPELKGALEEAARAEQTTVSKLLDHIVGSWLDGLKADANDEAVQRQLQRAAAKTLGKIHGGDPRRAEKARDLLRKRLTAKRRAG